MDSNSRRSSPDRSPFEVGEDLLYFSLAIAFALMILLSSKSFQLIPIQRSRFPLLNFITGNILDVAVLQAVSLVLLIWLCFKYLRDVLHWKGLSALIFSLVSCFLICTFLLMAEHWFLKPSFKYGRPQNMLSECTLTSVVLKKLGIGADEGTSAPSGFALRQTWILLFFLLLKNQKRVAELFSRRFLVSHQAAHWCIFVLVLAGRVYRGRHSLFDVGTSIGIGTLLFWFFILISRILIWRDQKVKRLMVGFLPPLGTFGIAIMFYAQETKWWLFVFIAMILIISLLHNRLSDISANSDVR
jgi:hypothetical protein